MVLENNKNIDDAAPNENDAAHVLVKNVSPNADESVSEAVEHFFLVNHPDNYLTHQTGFLGLWGEKVDAIEYHKTEIEKLKKEHKHEVFETFKVFQKEVENQLGKTIKSLRSDRRGEYMSQEFLDHLKDYGIIAHRTPPYTPQHNGVSERETEPY
nr:putative retrotransposon protein [Tanacetum cinerariifolium]